MKTRAPIAVVGVSALFPGSQTASGFWRDILAGKDLLSDVPASHWLIDDYYDPNPAAPDKTYAKRGGFLSPVDFDAISWGIPPNIIPATDTSQLLALILAEQVLRDAARSQFETMDRSRISVILGVTSAQELLATMVSRLQRPVWVKALREHGLSESDVQAACDRISASYQPWQESTFPGLLGNVVAGRIANRLDLGGTNCVVDAACASTFSAIHMAAQELYLGDSDLVITGGVDTLNDIFMYMCFSKTPALSLSGDCRPFSAQADGTMLGEGIGMVALKRLDDAERDGDRVYAVLKGLGTSSDGRSKSVYAPVSKGQARALRNAYEHAGYGPETVGLLEAHGTGTKAGDAAEFDGLKLVFGGEPSPRKQWCALGSVKSQIGHTKAAAGAAGLFKAVMALHHKALPPTIKVDQPNPKLSLETSPFYLNTAARPWVSVSEHPRRASVSAFGFGGSNFHVTLEEYTGANRAERLRDLPCEMVAVSGTTGAAAIASARGLLGRRASLARLAWESQRAFDAKANARLILIASDVDDLAKKIEKAAAKIESDATAAFSMPDGTTYGVGPSAGDVGFLFPGQGSQTINMGADLAMTFDRAIAAWDRAATLHFADQRLDQVVFPIPRFNDADRAADESLLRATEWAQPAIGCTSLSMLALLQGLGVVPSAVAGHSFGEITALHAAGVISEADMLRIARKRGELMADAAATPGAMTAVSGSLAAVEAALAQVGSDQVVIANHNSPNQIVISGAVEAVRSAEAALKEAGIVFKALPVATAFHSPVVAASTVPFAAFLRDVEFAANRLPVWAGASAAPYGADAQTKRDTLASQIKEPVRFVTMIENMYAAGVRTFVEVGPGSVLTKLVGDILQARTHTAVSLDRKGKAGLESFYRGLAGLAGAGVAMQFAALWEGYGEPVNADETAKPKLAVAISGANYGKAYPPEDGVLPPPNVEAAVQPMAIAPQPVAIADATALAPIANEASVFSPSMNEVSFMSPAPSSDLSSQWLSTWQEAQRQNAMALMAFQHAMSQSQTGFMQAISSSFQMLGGQVAQAPVFASQVHVPMQMTPPMMPPVMAPMRPSPQMIPTPAPAMATPMSVAAPHKAVTPIPAELLPEVAPVIARVTTVDLHSLMLTVVADKTGYPSEMLDLKMDLEGDLGIDSIKRVEILAAVQEKAPGMPAVDTSKMAALKTLGQIVDYMQGLLGSVASAPAVVTVAKPKIDLQALMLAVVADKTGYPSEMLDLKMDLEGDLGIDSIKRVEILAAVQEKAPGMPAVDTSKMAALKTLGQIVDYMQGLLGGAPVVAAKPMAVLGDAPTALGRFRLDMIETPRAGFAPMGLHASEVYVIGAAPSLCEALAKSLSQRGVKATAAKEAPATANAVVFLGGLRDIANEDEAIAVSREAFACARRNAEAFTTKGGLFMTVQDTGGAFATTAIPAPRAYLAGIAALVKTAAQEWPKTALKAIDLERANRTEAELALAIADEILLGGPDVEVGLLATGVRLCPRSTEEPVAPGQALITRGDVVVVSGGARGVTAACVVEWAKASKAKFVLLGRSVIEDEATELKTALSDADLKRVLLAQATARNEKPNPAELAKHVAKIQQSREIRSTLAAVSAAGGEARYLTVDVANAAALTAALVPVRKDWGPIAGLVHGAGVLADKLIAKISDADFEHVWTTKVTGMRALLTALATDPLKVVCLFSSVSARCGNNGQANYAMANEVLNKVAATEAARRGDSVIVKSMGWGPWEGGMVSPELKAMFQKLGVPMLPLAVGARMFVDEMQCKSGVELVVGGEPRPAALVSAEKGKALALSVNVNSKTHGYLRDHSIAGVPVVPVALVLEWFSRAATAFRRDLKLVGIENVKVLKGVRLNSFDADGDRFVVSVDGDKLELHGSDGTLYYRAKAVMTKEGVAPKPSAVNAGSLSARVSARIYGGSLFHTGAFHVINQVAGVGANGISGLLSGVHVGKWSSDMFAGEAWLTDVAACDGALQLALLWAEDQLGLSVLPMGVGSYRLYAPLSHGRVRCVAQCTRVGAEKVTADLALISEAGELLCELGQVELIVRPAAKTTTETANYSHA